MKMTFGEYRVGVTFNPGNVKAVDEIKRATATLIDLCRGYADDLGGGEPQRLLELAMTHYEDAAMWAVKAVTKPVYKD